MMQLSVRLRDLFRRFRRDRRGNVAMIFGVSALPILLATGAAIDYSGATRLKAKLQRATDLTTLATAKYVTATPSATTEEINAYAKAAFDEAMLPDAGTISPVRFERGRSQLFFDTNATYNTVFMKAFDYNIVPVGTSSGVDRGTTALEVVMVLDNTGSMFSNDRIGKLREAATKLVTILEGVRTQDRPVKIALVPFVTAVNVNGEGFNANWLDAVWDSSKNAYGPPLSKYHGENFDQQGGKFVNHMNLFRQIGITWKGCVEARPAPYDVDDTPPNAAVSGDTLFVPWFWPDEPDESGAANNYLSDEYSNSDKAKVQRNLTKYADKNNSKLIKKSDGTIKPFDEASGHSSSEGNTSGPNGSCPTPIVPLTEDLAKVRTAIDGMRAWNESGTNIAEGLIWGERVLSPTEPYTQGAAWGEFGVQKVVILLTDGENLVNGSYYLNKSDFSSIGYMAKARLGTSDKNTAKNKLLDRMKLACTRLKNTVNGKEKSLLYTITFEVGSTTLQNTFRSCATRPDMYYNVSTASQITPAFEAIAWELASLRITQ